MEYGNIYLQLIQEVNQYGDILKQMRGEIPSGSKCLVVGCGSRPDSLKFPNGVQVHGIDINHDFLEQAQQNAPHANLVRGDAHRLPFKQDIFGYVELERTLQWLRSPEEVLQEILQLLEPGGTLVLAEPDWSTLEVDNPNTTITPSIINTSTINLPHPCIGSSLQQLLITARFNNAEILGKRDTLPMTVARQAFLLEDRAQRAVDLGYISSHEAQEWIANLGQTASITVYIARGKKLPTDTPR